MDTPPVVIRTSHSLRAFLIVRSSKSALVKKKKIEVRESSNSPNN